MSSYHLERVQKWCPLWTQRHCTVGGWVRPNVPGSTGMKGAIIWREGRVSFIFFSMTSIKTQKYSTRTNRHESAGLYLQLWLAPAHLASRLQGVLGEGQPRRQQEGMRQEKTEGKTGRSTGRREQELGVQAMGRQRQEGSRGHLLLSPQDPEHS